VLAQFWDKGDDVLIPPVWVQAAQRRDAIMSGTVGMGIDLAPYGTAESAIGVRRGDNLVDVTAYPAGRTDFFINGDPEDTSGKLSPVRRKVRDYGPYVIVYDADGVGAGAIGDFARLHEWAKKNQFMLGDSQIIGFRGGTKVDVHYTNARSAWWWALRKRYERGGITMQVKDPTLDKQLSLMTYSYTQGGLIRVETKDEMRRRGEDSPDRGDCVMYTFAFSEALPDPGAVGAQDFVVSQGYATPDRDWRAGADVFGQNKKPPVNPITGLPDEL
jgi:hypothetical protein